MKDQRRETPRRGEGSLDRSLEFSGNVSSVTNKKDTNKKVEHGDASVATDDDYETADARLVSNSDSNEVWILDSGCTSHMTPNRDWLMDYSTN